MDKTKVRIIWNGMGGELDSVTVECDESTTAASDALISLVRGSILSPGDSFIVEEVA